MTILDKIIIDKQIEVANRKNMLSIDDLRFAPLYDRACISLKNSLLNSSTGIIAEFKRKSPSKGWIKENAEVLSIASGYNQAGASGISILTDTKYFGGVSEDLSTARPHIQVPILRKDFMIDTYQLHESKAMGADVVLLIAAALTIKETKELAKTAKQIGLEVLLEIHHRDELHHINEYIDIVGVNNRNLKTFEVDVDTSVALAELIPSEFLKISESGISSPHTIKELRAVGFQGFLMGENFMKEENPAQALQDFITQLL